MRRVFPADGCAGDKQQYHQNVKMAEANDGNNGPANNNDDHDFSSEDTDIDIDGLYNLIDHDDEASSSPTKTKTKRTNSESFHPGDHVWMWCEAAGGVRYQHHGIILYVYENTGPHIDVNIHVPASVQLKIADFTAPDSGTFALPDSITSSSASSHSHHRRRSLPHWHGVRVATYDNVSEWHKFTEQYEDKDDAQVEVRVVLQRVKFLLSNPHLIPKYDLLQSNCETVAVWCKTGKFRTFQVTGLVHGGKRNSATVAASSVIASSLLGPFALPAIAGAALSFSALTLKENSHERMWKERTRILNDEFERWQEGQDSGCIIM